MVIKYIYDFTGGQKRPVACLVVKDERHALSVCNPNDRFNKKRACSIAVGRINVGSKSDAIPNRKIMNPLGEVVHLEDEVNFALNRIQERRTRTVLQ